MTNYNKTANFVDDDIVDIDDIDTDDSGLGPIPPGAYPFGPLLDDREEVEEVKAFLTDMSLNRHSETLYRDDVIDQVIAVLISRDKPNALLVGPAGSGKTHIAEEIAYRITNPKYSIPRSLRGYKIYSVNLSDIVSGSGLVGDLERKVKNLVKYLEDGKNKAILFLDEVHMLFNGETYKKVAQMLKPALSRGRFKVIAATTTQEVKKVEEDPAFNRRFTRVLVDELTVSQTVDIVDRMITTMQEHYGVTIGNPDGTAETIVRIADEFCSVGSHRPDNALTLLDRTIANYVVHHKRGKVKLTKSLIEDTAYRMTSGNSRVKKLDEKALRKKLSGIYGQEDIIEDLIEVLRVYDMHIRPRTKPLTFLFAGPSGVGKSEIARVIASEYICEKPIVLNMTEFSSSSSVNRIIGAPVGYAGYDSNGELPFDKLDTNPYQLIILDEFEKCDRSIQRLFMSAFDEGVMKTNSGKEIDFSKSIIIATTNAGCTTGASPIGFGAKDAERSKNLTISELSDYFDVELLNRFSHKYRFHSIGRETYINILREIYAFEVASLDYSKIGASVREILPPCADSKLLEKLAEKSYHPELGARPALTIVTEYIDMMLLRKEVAYE